MRAARSPSASSAGRAAPTGGAAGSWAGRPGRQPETATALASPSPITTTATTVSLVRDMALTIPSVRAATFGETTPAARPAASRLAVCLVDTTSAGGADGAADTAGHTAATD